MAEARALTRPRAVWESIKDFLAAHTVSSTGGLLFLLLVIFLLYPIIAVLTQSVSGPEGFTLEYYRKFLTRPWYYQSFSNTLLLGVLTTSVCLSAGFCIAYITTRGPVRFRTPLKLIALLPLIAPPMIFGLVLIILLGNNGIITRALGLEWSIYGFTGPVIAQTLAFLPLAYLMIENTLSSLNPNLEDSAANLGATEGKILRSITIPLLAPGFLKAALIVFVMAVAEFGNVALLCGRTPFLAPDAYLMIIGMADFNLGSVMSVFLILPCAVIFIVQGYLIRGKAYTTIVGKPVAVEPRRITPAILIPMLAVCFIVCILILVTFGVIGVGGFVQLVGIDNTFTLKHFLNMRANQALITSLRVSLLAGLFGALFGVLLAYVIMRGKFRGRAALEGIGLAGFTLPGTVLGIGYVLAFKQPPLQLLGTMMILVLSCVFRFLAVGMEAGITKLQQLSIEVEEASLNLGASTATTFRRIVLPIIIHAVMYGFLYVFVTSMISLSAVVFLVSPTYQLASVFLFQWALFGYFGLACGTAVKIVLIVGACLAFLQYSSKWTGLSITAKGGA